MDVRHREVKESPVEVGDAAIKDLPPPKGRNLRVLALWLGIILSCGMYMYILRGGLSTILHWLGSCGMVTSLIRRTFMELCMWGFLVRTAIVIHSYPRSHVTWSAIISSTSVLFFVMLTFAWVGSINRLTPRANDATLAMILVVVGFALNAKAWKELGESVKEQRLCMRGMRRYVRHPDVVPFIIALIGWSIIVGQPQNLRGIPLGALITFSASIALVLNGIGRDAILADKFPRQWKAYSRSTKRFIPKLI